MSEMNDNPCPGCGRGGCGECGPQLVAVVSEHRHECSRRHLVREGEHYELCACGARRLLGVNALGEWELPAER